MPCIVFAQPKGGAGKSTSATILASELAVRGAEVCVIDADPNRPLVRWSLLPNKPKNVTVIGDVTEDTRVDIIEAETARVPFVIVDLEGTKSRMTSYAMSRADLCILPCQGSDLDAVQVAAAVKEVKNQERAFRQKIPYAVVFTRTSAAITPRTIRAIETDLKSNGVPVFNVRLHEREAFKALHSFGGPLSSLDTKDVPNVPSAMVNAAAFVDEVVAILRSQRDEAA